MNLGSNSRFSSVWPILWWRPNGKGASRAPGHPLTHLVLLQYPDHLLFAESAPAHLPSPLWANTNPQVRTIKGGRSLVTAEAGGSRL